MKFVRMLVLEADLNAQTKPGSDYLDLSTRTEFTYRRLKYKFRRIYHGEESRLSLGHKVVGEGSRIPNAGQTDQRA